MIRSLNGIGNSSSSNITNNVYVNTLENGEAIEIEQVGTTTANKVNLAFKQNTTQASSVANNDLILIADNATGKVVKYVEANLVGQVLTATTPIEINNNVISTTFTKSSTDHLLNKTITSFVGNSLSNITTPSSGGTLALTSQFLTGPNFGTAATPIRTNTFGSIYQPTILNGSSISLGGKISNQIIIKGANASASVNSDIQFLENGNTICGNVGFTAGKLQLINNNSTDTLIGTSGNGNYKLEFISDTKFKASATNNLNDGTITNLTSLNGHSIPTDTTPLVSTTSLTTSTNFGTSSTQVGSRTFGNYIRPIQISGTTMGLSSNGSTNIVNTTGNETQIAAGIVSFRALDSAGVVFEPSLAGGTTTYNGIDVKNNIIKNSLSNGKVNFGSDTQFKSSGVNDFNTGSITNLNELGSNGNLLINGTSITLETGTGVGNTLQLDGTIVNVDATTFLNLKGSQITFEPKLGTGSVVFGAAANGTYYDIDVKDNIIKNTLTNANGTARPVHFGSDVELTNRTMNCGIVSASGNIFGANVVVDSVSLRDSGGGSGTFPLVLPNLMTDFAGGIISGNPTRRMGGTSSASEIKGSTIKLDSDVVNIGTTNSCVSTFKGSITTTGLINNKNLGTMDTAIATNATAIATINNAGYITASSADTLTNKSISYSQLTGTPTIPTNNTELSNGRGYITASTTDTLTNKSFNDEAQFNTGLKVYNGGTSGGHVDFYNSSLASNKMRLKAKDSLATGGGGTLLLPNVAGTLALTSELTNFITASSTDTLTNKTIQSCVGNSSSVITFPSSTGTLGLKADIDTNAVAITANTGNISENAGNINSNTANISTLLNAGYITASSADTLTNKSISYSQLTGTPTIPDTTTASNFGTSSSSNIIVGSTTKTLELQGTSIDIEDKDGTSIIEITDSDTKFKGTDISIIGRNATTSPKIYFTNFTNPFTSWIRLVGQADAGASGTHTLTLPQATGTLALTSDIPSAGNGIFTIAGSFTSKVATATQCNEYIFSSGVNANGSCRIVLQSDTNNPTGGPDDKNTEILFKKENDLVQGSIGMGRPGTETDDNQMIIDCKTFSDGIKLQTQGTTRLSIEPTQIVASKKIVANGGIETTSINLNNPAHVDIYTPEIEVSTLTDDNTFIEMRSGTGNSSSTKVSTIKFYNKNNTKSAFIGLDTDNKLHLTNNSFGGNNLKVGSSGIDVEALGISSGNASYPISWKSNIMTTYYAYLYNVASGNGWHLNAVGDQFLCKTNRDILYYNTDLIGNGSLITGYTKPPLGDIYCEDIFCDELNYQTCNTCSDARLKKNLKPIENAIETLNKLTPLLYDKKVKDETDIWGNEYIPDSGFIAQDVYNQVPELRFIVNNVADDIPENFDSSGNLIRDCIGWDIVEDKHATSVPVDSPPDASGNPNPDAGKQLTEATYKKVLNPDKKLSINYEELTAYLVKGIQEQDVRIKHLENIITKLTSSASFANFKKII